MCVYKEQFNDLYATLLIRKWLKIEIHWFHDSTGLEELVYRKKILKFYYNNVTIAAAEF